MARKIISHYNFISGDINLLNQTNAPEGNYEIYCKRLHTITNPTADLCNSCPYFGGIMDGKGHECIWEDINPVEVNELYIEPNDKQKEFLRVSKLIDRGLLQKG